MPVQEPKNTETYCFRSDTLLLVDQDLTNSGACLQLDCNLMITLGIGRLLAIKMEAVSDVICFGPGRWRGSHSHRALLNRLINERISILPHIGIGVAVVLQKNGVKDCSCSTNAVETYRHYELCLWVKDQAIRAVVLCALWGWGYG